MKFKRITALAICVILIQSVVINALPSLVKELNNQTVRPGMSMTPGTSITPYYNTANWAGTLFPAGIFRDALLKEMGIQIGKNSIDLTVLDVLDFRGNLDLRNRGITNIDGIIHIKRANKIDLSNTLNADGTFASSTPNRITDIDRNLRTGNPISPNAPNLGGDGDNELLSVGTINFSGNSINKTVSHLSRGISNLILDNQIYHSLAPINLLAGTTGNITLKIPYAKVRHVEITPQSPNPIYKNYDLKPSGTITGGYVGEVQNPLTYTHDAINNMLSVEMVTNKSGTIKINTLFDVNIIYYKGTALSGNARGAGMNGSMFQDIKVYHPINIKTDDVAATVFLTGVEKTLTTSDGTIHNGTPVLTGVANGFGDIASRSVINVVGGGGNITEITINVGGTVHTFSSVADANAFLSAGVTGETEILVKARPKGRIMNMDSYATGFVGINGDNSTSSTGEHFLGNPATFSFEPNPFYVADKLYIGTEGAIPNTLLIDQMYRLSLPHNYGVNWNGKAVNGSLYETNGSNVDKHLTATASTSFPGVGTVFGVKFKPTVLTKPSIGGKTNIVGGYATQTYDSTRKIVERFANTSSFAITPDAGWYLNHINLSSYDLAQSLLNITGGNVSADVIAHGQSFHLTGAINQTGNTSTITFDNLAIPLDLKANFSPTIKVSLLGGLGGNLTIDKEINGRYATNQFSIQAQKGWYPKIAISSMNETPTYVNIANGTLETDLFIDGKTHKITGTITTNADGLTVILDPYNIPLDIEVSLHTSISAHNFTSKYGGDDGGTLTITGALPNASNRYDTNKIVLKPTPNWKVDEQSFLISAAGEINTNPTQFALDKTTNTLKAKIVMGGKTYDITAKQTYDSTLDQVEITLDSVPIPLDIGIEFKPIVNSYNLNEVKESASVFSSEKETRTEISLKISNGWLLDKLFVSPSKTIRNPQNQELLIDEKGNVSATVISDGKSHTITGFFDVKSGIIRINRTLFPVDIGASFKATSSAKNLTHDNLGGTITLGGETVDTQTKRYLDDTTIATTENGWQTVHYFIANMGELSTASQKINVQADGTFSVDLSAYNKVHTFKGKVEIQNEKVIIKLDNVIVPVDIGFEFTPTISMLNLTPNNAGTTIEVSQEVSIQKTDRHLSTQVSWKPENGWLVGTKSLKIAPINGLFENKVATLKIDEKTGKASANISFEGKNYAIKGTIQTDDAGKTTLRLEELPCPVDIGILVQPSLSAKNLTHDNLGGTISYMDTVVETTTQRGIENTITFEASKNWNMSATDIVVAPMGNLNVKSKPFTINKRTGEARTVLTIDGRKYEIEAIIHMKKNNRLFIKSNQITFELISSEIPIDIGVIFSPNKAEIPNNITSSQSQSQSQSSSLTSPSSSSSELIKAPANTGA